MKEITTVIWVHDLGKIPDASLTHAPEHSALVLSIPRLPACFLMLSDAQEFYVRSRRLYQEQLLQLARQWGIPASQCWLEDTHRVSVRALSREVGHPVQVIEVGQAPPSWGERAKAAWGRLGCQVKTAVVRLLWFTPAVKAVPLATWRKFHPSLSMLKKHGWQGL